ncbi:hypothetical protein BT63DRAFT_459341 [Microthyrium microscopicum]|uniref:Uncharacterized protein n=1 Tax=Microthyrium microscopicum TaxID=703497 RepID=A0A6A6U489_9PEZI|nr:hypothetical protein BT63DRAFT_459341 [Microthyrium microscopicum]
MLGMMPSGLNEWRKASRCESPRAACAKLKVAQQTQVANEPTTGRQSTGWSGGQRRQASSQHGAWKWSMEHGPSVFSLIKTEPAFVEACQDSWTWPLLTALWRRTGTLSAGPVANDWLDFYQAFSKYPELQNTHTLPEEDMGLIIGRLMMDGWFHLPSPSWLPVTKSVTGDSLAV